MKKSLKPLLVLLVAVGAAFSGFHLISKTGSSLQLTEDRAEIARFQSVVGEVTRRLPYSTTFESAQVDASIYSQETIFTGTASEAVISLEDGGVVRLGENSRIALEADPSRGETIIATVLDGSLSLVTAGEAGRLRVYRDGQEIDIRMGDQPRVPVLSANEGAKIDSHQLAVVPTSDDDAASEEPSTNSMNVNQPKTENSLSTTKTIKSGTLSLQDTLSDDEIIKGIRAQTRLFQKCYLSFINRTKPSSEASLTAEQRKKVVVAFEIQNSGRVTKPQLVRTDVEDSSMNRCVLEVLERTNFASFSGDAIPIEEFPILLE